MLTLPILFIPTMMTSAVDEDFFPIMGWDIVPNNRKLLAEMAECGLNVAGFAAPENLDIVHQVGLKAIVSDRRVSGYDLRTVDLEAMRENVASLVREVGAHPALIGYYLKDEPNAEMFPGLAAISKMLLAVTPSKIPYINLYPNYANSQQLGTETYEEHVESYLNTVDPPIISYDHYALMEGGYLRDGYFPNLETIRYAALEYERPFWYIIQANAHFGYREPSAADIRFQVFTALAYGAKGITYFTYFAPHAGNFRMSPVDQFGNRTATWYHVQHVSLILRRIGPIMLKLTSTGVYHIGDVPEGSQGLPGNTLVAAVQGEGRFVLGEFVHQDGSNYIMLVNKDFERSTSFRIDLSDPEAQLQRISPYSGNIGGMGGENWVLAPGQGVLLRIAKGN